MRQNQPGSARKFNNLAPKMAHGCADFSRLCRLPEEATRRTRLSPAPVPSTWANTSFADKPSA
jgi:hypothetical protein